MKYFYFIINVIFFSKKKFRKPKQTFFLIVNGDQSDFIKKYINNSDLNIVYNRFSRGIERNAEINIFVLLNVIFNFKFSIIDYIKYYIKFSKPKVVMTLIDNDSSFYELGNNSLYKTILIQNAFRSTQLDVFYKKEELKKRNFKCDYILVFNKHVGKLYNEFLKGKVFQIGSFRSNSIRKKNLKKKYDILYVSRYKGNEDEAFFIKEHNITWGDVRLGEEKIIEHLKNYIKTNRDINLFILGCVITNKRKEIKYWNEKLNDVKFTFLPQDKNRNTYQIIDETKVLISIDSSLGYESIARGNKICVFSVRPDEYPANSSKFGWPSRLSDKGFFWTNSVEYSEFKRVLEDTYAISEKDYFMNKTKNIIPDQMIFDEDNKIFQKIIKELGTGNENN